ncbi:MAG TPA: TMEM165/GDT1 family protein [Stellaceae bacterium]|nr:TMEM165/GDT1 family protein [Stellaceae bacterium]
MHPVIESALVVAIAEIGDRTQLLSLVLSARYRRPLAITCGILIATIANHALAGLIGQWIGNAVEPQRLRWILGLSFIAMAAWALIPERLDEKQTATAKRGTAFPATLVSFFLAEIGDKTQFATAALAARFDDVLWVVLGTTAGMMAANLPVVLMGSFASHRFDPRWARYGAAALLAAQGALTLLGARLL